MKNIKKYLGLTLIALLFSAVFTDCKEDDEVGSDNLGLAVKVFSPTKVVPGQVVTINGSGFGDVTEVVFPGGIAVSSFETVSPEMIRVVTPSGINIAEEGEKLIVRSASDEAESPRLMTQGHTEVRAFSAEPGEEVKAKSILKVFGKDMEFVSKATFVGSDDNEIVLEAKDFYRIATGSVAIKVPADVKEGLNPASIETLDGLHFDLPEFNYAAASNGGHWETVKTVIWENDDPAGHGAVNWNGTYRFSNVDAVTGEEIYAVPMDQWELLKSGTFYVDIEGEAPQVRVTNGWWDANWGDDIMPGNELMADNGDGTWTLTIDLAGSDCAASIDQKHLLFTGGGYTPLRIYVQEEIWIEGEDGHWERKSLWKNDGTLGAVNWNGTYRFSNEEAVTGEECYAFPMEDWEIIKNSEFYVDIEGEAPQVRVTNGWWDANWGDDIMPGNELMADNGDGTWTLTINLAGSDCAASIDQKHLLFTGSGYTVKEIYVNEWVGGAAGPKEVVIWENDDPTGHGAVNWNGTYRFSNEEAVSGEEIYAVPADQWEVLKTGTFYLDIEGENPQVRVTNGWWDANWGDDIMPGNELMVDNGNGTWTLTLNIAGSDCAATIDQKHLLFTGSGYTPLKLYYK